MIFVARGKDRPARRTDARIHNHDVYRPGGEVRIGLRNRERAIEHVESLHGVADIDDLRLRHDIQDDAFHCAYKMIVAAEVGSQSNNRTLRQGFLTVGRHKSPKTRK